MTYTRNMLGFLVPAILASLALGFIIVSVGYTYCYRRVSPC